ncbi:MAG: very short patch repair endonuclease [Chthoniobacter sp.]
MDRVDAATRSRNMASVRGKDTGPEIAVRQILHSRGYRFRLHRRSLPGCPDLVFPSRKKVVFVHGCFWHSHPDCPRAKRPTSNAEFWESKISRNVERDAGAVRALQEQGWKVLVVWECETRHKSRIAEVLEDFLGPPNREANERQRTHPVRRKPTRRS